MNLSLRDIHQKVGYY